MRKIALSLLLTFFSSTTFAKYYTYYEIQDWDLDKMQKVISEKLNKSKEFFSADVPDSEADLQEQKGVDQLKEALVFMFSRPDRDKLIQDLIEVPRNKLRDNHAYDESLLLIVNSAIRMAKDKSLNKEQRTTQFFIIENVMKYSRVELPNNTTIQKVFRNIQEAELKADDEVSKLFQKRAEKPPLLSRTAEEVLKKDLPKKN